MIQQESLVDLIKISERGANKNRYSVLNWIETSS